MGASPREAKDTSISIFKILHGQSEPKTTSSHNTAPYLRSTCKSTNRRGEEKVSLSRPQQKSEEKGMKKKRTPEVVVEEELLVHDGVEDGFDGEDRVAL